MLNLIQNFILLKTQQHTLPVLLFLYLGAMKKYYTLLVLLFTFAAFTALQAQKGCPKNFGGTALLEVKKKVKNHMGETVAFDAEVIESGSGYNDIPYFRVKLDNGEMVWIASMISGRLTAKGTHLRILGYIDEVGSDDEVALRYNKDGFQIRAFAMLDHLSKLMHRSNAFQAETQAWLSGKIPKNRE